MSETLIRWAGLWRDREYQHLIYENCQPVLFSRRAEMRAYLTKRFGYIRERKDLRSAPFFWTMPQAIKVKIKIASRPALAKQMFGAGKPMKLAQLIRAEEKYGN